MKLSERILHLSVICVALLFIQWDCNCNPTDDDEPIGLGYSLTSPANGSTVWSRNIYFDWSWISFQVRDIDSMFLRIRHDTETVFTEIPMALITDSDRPYFESTYEIDTLSPSSTYHWRIRAVVELFNDSKIISNSYISSFTTAEYFVEQGDVHNPSPDSAAIGIGLNPFFSWEVYNPVFVPYDFNIYLGTTTDPPLLASGLSATHYDYVDYTLDYHTLYYWQVEAYYGTDTIDGPLWEFTTDYRSDEEIFALFQIDARQGPTGYHTQEEFWARFDGQLALNDAIDPLQADSVLIEEDKLDWIADSLHYNYFVFSEPVIQNGESNKIRVFGNSAVPNLNINVVFPACTLSIISPLNNEIVPIGGFEVTWDGAECGGNVWLTLMDGNNSTGVAKEVVNDGLDSLTADDLAPLGGQTGNYDLHIIKLVEENIDASGYRPESLIRMRAYQVMPGIRISNK